MPRTIPRFILALVAIPLALSVGCSDETTSPPLEESDPPSLGSPYAMASWMREGGTCENDQFCLSSVIVQTVAGGAAEIRVQVSGDHGLISQSAALSSEDFDQYTDLVEEIIWSRENVLEGCGGSDGLRESINTFAGDAGWAAAIEGCDEPLIQDLRALNLELVARYFPQD